MPESPRRLSITLVVYSHLFVQFPDWICWTQKISPLPSVVVWLRLSHVHCACADQAARHVSKASLIGLIGFIGLFDLVLIISRVAVSRGKA